jgi:hypothetical protein
MMRRGACKGMTHAFVCACAYKDESAVMCECAREAGAAAKAGVDYLARII